MKKLLVYLKKYKMECILGPLFKLLEASFELTIPLVVASIVDVGIVNKDVNYILKMCLLMVLLGVVGLISAVTAQYFAAKAAVGFSTTIRHTFMEHILKLGYSQIDQIGTSTLITRMTSDINQVQNGINLTIRLLLRSPFVVFGAMIMAFTIDVSSALVFAGVIPVLCVVVFGIMLITMPGYKGVQSRLDQVTASTRENLTGLRVLRAFCLEKEESEKFSSQTGALKNVQIFVGRISALMNPLTFVIINFAVVILVYTGAVKVNSGVLSQGAVIALYNYMSQILVELIKMANLIITMTKAAACGNRIQSVLELQPSQSFGDKDINIQGSVEFRNVTAKYANAGAPSLENISFSVRPGQTVGVIGGTGSGKTTLVNLIPRLYDVVEGQVLLDGHNVLEMTQDCLNRQVAVVPQKAALFKGTLRENICFGKEDVTDEQVLQALEAAQAKEIAEDKENGLDTLIEQGGANLSGGQRQRITIARALIRQPKILILDDSASALDYATDAKLRMSIRDLKSKPTTFIVSQRAASIRYADLILVLDDGLLVGIGKHEELLRTCPVYQEIFHSQFKGEVTDNG